MHLEIRRALNACGRRRSYRYFFALSLGAMCMLGCDSQPPNETPASRTAETVVEAPVDPLAYSVPEGDASELIQFMSEVVSQPPRGETDEEQTVDVGRQMDARIIAAERLDKIADSDSQRLIAKRTKLESLRVLGMLSRENGRTLFSEYAEALAGDPSSEIAKLGRLGKYQMLLDDFVASDSRDPIPVIERLQALLENEQADLPLYNVANETAMLLKNVGLALESNTVLERIGKTFANHSNEEIAAAARRALAESHLSRLRVAYQDTIGGEPDAESSLISAAQEMLQADEIPAPIILALLNMTQNLEYSGKVPIAGELYELAAGAADRVKDAQAQERSRSLAEQGLRRIQLVGQPFDIVGQTVDGEAFSWSDYEGKVVLVDFWATWCGPCIKEIPNVRENYDRFHEAGFEVVGVNLDEQRDLVTRFLKQNNLPWATVVSDDEEALGFDDENARRYNVHAIPFLVLIGRDGNVDALHLRGDLLTERLERLLRESDETEATDGVDDSATAAPAEPDTDTDTEAEAEVGVEVGVEVEMEIAQSNDDEPQSEETTELGQTETPPPDDPTLREALIESNPYLAAEELSASELVLYLLELADKPKSIQARSGFREAVVDAADRILAQSDKEKYRRIASQKKLNFIHRDARVGDEQAQAELIAFVEILEQDMPDLAREEIRFFRLEQQALQSDEADVDLIDRCCEYLSELAESLDGRHLRLASATVELVNRLPLEEREPYFDRLSKALLTSSHREVAWYGKRLAAKPKSGSELVGQALALDGITTDGNVFDIKFYREQVVVVDFWATWCGPCRKAHAILAEFAERHDEVRIVGVSLDTDDDALSEYLKTAEVPGITLFGENARKAADDYGIRALPSFLVVDTAGKIQAVTDNPHELDQLVTRLLDVGTDDMEGSED